MRQVGLTAPEREANGRVTRCEVTPWLRRAVAPVTAAIGWECTCIPDRTPAPGRIDAEAAFLLAAPTLELPSEINGVCRLAVEFRRGSELDFAGVTIRVADGRVESCVARVDGEPDAWATGGVLDWFRWMRDMDGHRIEVGETPRSRMPSPTACAADSSFQRAIRPNAARSRAPVWAGPARCPARAGRWPPPIDGLRQTTRAHLRPTHFPGPSPSTRKVQSCIDLRILIVQCPCG